MFYHWSQATDGTGEAVRVVLFDYHKAFDLVNHKILVAKINGLDMLHSIKAWVTDFLTNRHRCIRLSPYCFSEWDPVPAGVPQGMKFSLWLFFLMINDLKVDADVEVCGQYVNLPNYSSRLPG